MVGQVRTEPGSVSEICSAAGPITGGHGKVRKVPRTLSNEKNILSYLKMTVVIA